MWPGHSPWCQPVHYKPSCDLAPSLRIVRVDSSTLDGGKTGRRRVNHGLLCVGHVAEKNSLVTLRTRIAFPLSIEDSQTRLDPRNVGLDPRHLSLDVPPGRHHLGLQRGSLTRHAWHYAPLSDLRDVMA